MWEARREVLLFEQSPMFKCTVFTVLFFLPALPSSMPAYYSRPVDFENTVFASSPPAWTSKGQAMNQSHGSSSFKELLGMKTTLSDEGSRVWGLAAPGDGEKEARWALPSPDSGASLSRLPSDVEPNLASGWTFVQASDSTPTVPKANCFSYYLILLSCN